VEPQHLISQPVDADDHRGRHVGRLEVPTPLRDQLPVASEHDCCGPTGRAVHRDLATTVVAERLGDELSCHGGYCCLIAQCLPGDGSTFGAWFSAPGGGGSLLATSVSWWELWPKFLKPPVGGDTLLF
jgi:hypothetical protein